MLNGCIVCRVLMQEKGQYRIIGPEGEHWAKVSGKFRYGSETASDYPAVGDYVMAEPVAGGMSVIHAVLPRKSVFVRKAAGTGNTEQVVAANIDTVFLCMSLNNDFNIRRLGGKLRYIFIGGSCLPYDIRQAFIDQGMNPMNAYALSETSSGFSIDYPDVTDMDSAGTLLEYVDAKVIDPDEDGIGELAIKGPNVFHGYLNDPEATKRAFNEDGYFLTGDLGKIVGNMVYVKGRKDTMLVLLNGENVSSKRIADKVKEADPRIASVKAYIRDDLLTCDIFVKDKADIEGDWQSVIDKVNEDLSKYEKIRKFSVVDIGALLKG